MRCADAIEISNWACLPEHGGLLDQDEIMMEDIFTWFKVYRQVEQELENPDANEPEKPPPREIRSVDVNSLFGE